jgi:group II intron reverse transcriptase/maturase
VAEEPPPGGQVTRLNKINFIRMDNKGIGRLKAIAEKNKQNIGYINFELYNLFYCEDLYIKAYEKLKSNKGSLSSAMDPKISFQGYSLKRVQKIISSMRTEQWHPRIARRVYIPKPGQPLKKRPLGVQDPDAKIIQEITRVILTTIYEPTFLDNSYGWRSERGAHNPLKHIKENWDGLTYALEGDIVGQFDNLSHSILVNILRKKIKDERFINLIWKLLRTNFWSKEEGITKSIIGRPQGSILSPILSNIYLHELDKFVIQWGTQNIRKEGSNTRRTYAQQQYNQIRVLEGRLEKVPNDPESLKEIVALRKNSLKKLEYYRLDKKPERFYYYRFADDFIIGLFAPLDKVEKLKKDLTDFLRDTLVHELHQTKTKITPLHKDKAIFLGHEIYISSSNKFTRKPVGLNKRISLVRTTGKFIKVELAKEKVLKKLHLKGFCDGSYTSRPKKRLCAYDDFEIVKYYASVWQGIENFYSGTTLTNIRSRIHNILVFSCAKTLATKHKNSCAKQFKQRGMSLLTTKPAYNIVREDGYRARSKERQIELVRPKQRPPKWNIKRVFTDPTDIYLGKYTRSSLLSCCGRCSSSENVQMHHVRSLKGIKPNTFEELHGYIKRLQVPLCAECHQMVTSGKY